MIADGANAQMYRFRRKMRSLLWRLYCAVSPYTISRFTLSDGSLFEYPIKSGIGYTLFVGSFEFMETEFVKKYLKQGDVFFDVGANGGIFTILAAKKVGAAGHVYAFEPGTDEVELLRRNVALNQLKNVTIVETAVGNQVGETDFGISEDGAMNSLAKTNHPEQKIMRWNRVEIITLDEYVRKCGIGKVDMIKIDVEGAEKLVLSGAKGILKDHKIVIIFEASDLNAVGFGYTVKEFISDLLAEGFSVGYFDGKGEVKEIQVYDDRFGNDIYNFVVYN